MAPFYGWGSTVSRLQSNYEETVDFLPLDPHNYLVPIQSASEGWKTELTLEPSAVLNLEPLDWESRTLFH